MVFATDFDPTQASARRKSAQRVTHSAVQSATQTTPQTVVQPHSQVNMGSKEVATLPLKAKPSLPLWLQVLNRVQHGSTAVATLLIAGALVLYGSSVYTDKSTDRALTRLNRLQSESQQLTAANEAMKQSLAKQAMQEGSGLEPYEAGDVLFVTPEPLRPSPAPVEVKPERIRPLGY